MSSYSKYKDTPSMIKVTSNRKVKYTNEVIDKLIVEKGVKVKKEKVHN